MDELIQELPFDLQEYIYEMVLMVRRPKALMSSAMKLDIETYHLFVYIREKYKLIYGDIHEYWLDNDMVSFLNDHECFMYGEVVNPDLKRVFPNMRNDEIIAEIEGTHHIRKYWIHMPPKKRVNMFLTTYMELELSEIDD